MTPAFIKDATFLFLISPFVAQYGSSLITFHNEEEWTLFCLLERAIFAIVVELSDFEAIVSILQVMDVQRSLEHDLELLCLTGVEDKLQVITCRVHRKLN